MTDLGLQVNSTVPSLHAIPTAADGTPCGTEGNYSEAAPHGLEACGFDGAGAALEHIYGPLQPAVYVPNTPLLRPLTRPLRPHLIRLYLVWNILAHCDRLGGGHTIGATGDSCRKICIVSINASSTPGPTV